MTAIYQIVLYDELGTRLAIIDDYRSLQFKRTINGAGFFTLLLSDNDSKKPLFANNCLIEIKRKIPGVLDWYTEFTGYVENMQSKVFQNGNTQFTVVGSGLNGLLTNRIIAYFEGTAEADKNAVSETVMKEFVSENIGILSLVSNGRFADGNLLNFTTDTDGANGDVWEGDRSGKNLLETLQEVSNFATIDFAVETNGSVGSYIFKTYVGQLGANRTTSGLDATTGLNSYGNAPHVFSPKRGNVQTSTVDEKHRKEKNRIYVYGQGTGATREIVDSESATFDDTNYINLKESMRGGGSQSSLAQLASKANEVLEDLKALEKFEIVPMDIPSSLYGVHFFLGDVVTIELSDVIGDKKIASVNITLAGGKGESSKKFDFEDIAT